MKGKYDEHYKNLNPQPIEVIENWELDFHLANVLKYISRAGKKAGESELKDLEKAKVYLNRKIEKLMDVEGGMTFKEFEEKLCIKTYNAYRVGQVWTCVNNPKYTLTIKAIHNNGRMLVCVNDGAAEVKHMYFTENGKPVAGAPEDVFSNFQLTVLKTEA